MSEAILDLLDLGHHIHHSDSCLLVCLFFFTMKEPKCYFIILLESQNLVLTLFSFGLSIHCILTKRVCSKLPYIDCIKQWVSEQFSAYNIIDRSFLILSSPPSFHASNNFPFPYERKHALSAFCETGLFYLKWYSILLMFFQVAFISFKLFLIYGWLKLHCTNFTIHSSFDGLQN